MWNPIWGFDFKITISEHVVTVAPGQQIAVPVTITLIRGKPQKLDLDVSTNWESMGLSAKIVFDFTTPMPQWKGNLFIKASHDTPPDSYLFTVRASAQGTFHTSEDAITVVVEPKKKEKKEKSDQQSEAEQSETDLDNLFQPKSTAPASVEASSEPNASFNLDKLFQPGPLKPPPAAPDAVDTGGLSAGIIITVIFGGIVIFFSILMMNGGFGSTRTCVGTWSYECSDCSGSYKRTTHNGKYIGSCRATSVRNGDICTLSCK